MDCTKALVLIKLLPQVAQPRDYLEGGRKILHKKYKSGGRYKKVDDP